MPPFSVFPKKKEKKIGLRVNIFTLPLITLPHASLIHMNNLEGDRFLPQYSRSTLYSLASLHPLRYIHVKWKCFTPHGKHECNASSTPI
jgi:hypothetical protein